MILDELIESNIIETAKSFMVREDGKSVIIEDNEIELINIIIPNDEPLMKLGYYSENIDYNIFDYMKMEGTTLSYTFNINTYGLNIVYLSLFHPYYYHILPKFLLTLDGNNIAHEKLPYVIDDIRELFGLNYINNIKAQLTHELSVINNSYQKFPIQSIYNIMFTIIVITNYINSATELLSIDDKLELITYYTGNIGISSIIQKIEDFLFLLADKESEYQLFDKPTFNRKYSYILNTLGINTTFNITEINNEISNISEPEIINVFSEMDRNI